MDPARYLNDYLNDGPCQLLECWTKVTAHFSNTRQVPYLSLTSTSVTYQMLICIISQILKHHFSTRSLGRFPTYSVEVVGRFALPCCILESRAPFTCSFSLLLLGPPHTPFSLSFLLGPSHTPFSLSFLLGPPHTPFSLSFLLGPPHTPFSLSFLLDPSHTPFPLSFLLGPPHTPFRTFVFWVAEASNLEGLLYLLVGLARTVYVHRIWPYILWFPCQKYRT